MSLSNVKRNKLSGIKPPVDTSVEDHLLVNFVQATDDLCLDRYWPTIEFSLRSRAIV